jgi:membrane associated rhomboid family serine protease
MPWNMPVATYAIMGITVICSILGFGNRRLLEKNLFSVGAVLQNREVYRLLTSQFFHAGWGHLAFNMISLYSFGAVMERHFGPLFVAALYFCGALCGDLVALAIKRKNPAYAAIGASGAVCAVIFASIFLLPGGSIYIMPFPVPIPSWVYALIFMAVSLYGIGSGTSMIGHEAHVGGALAGIAWAVVSDPSIIARDYLLLAALTVPVAALLVYYMRRA